MIAIALDQKGEVGARVRQAREAMPGKVGPTELSRRLGIPNPQRLSNWESGKHDPPYSILQAIARETGVSLQWLVTGQGSIAGKPPLAVHERREVSDPRNIVTYDKVDMPYAGNLPAGDWSDPLESEEFEEVESRLWKRNRFCARIVGDSCHPALQRNDFVIFEASTSPIFGRIVVAERSDHAATVKVLEWDAATSGPVLRPVNPNVEPPDADEWRVIGFLVCATWRTIYGAEVTHYQEDGIRPEDLMTLRS